MTDSERSTFTITETKMVSYIEKSRLEERPLKDIRVERTSLYTVVSLMIGANK